MEELQNIRPEYSGRKLDRDELLEDPIEQFLRWFDQAAETEGENVTGMTLATVGEDGTPSARIVLLKGVDEGFVFFTNYASRKGEEIAANPKAALVFWWPSLHRQVRVEGRIERLDGPASDRYFNSRPRGSRIGAIASPQSRVIENRDELHDRVEKVSHEYAESDEIPRPDYWGGFRLHPARIEFWQGREDRLHDRFRYELVENRWMIDRLAP